PHDRRGGGRRRPARAPRGHPRYSRAHLAARGRPRLVNRRGPRLLAEETHMGVLDGIKILELARVPPAELPGMMLADMGADVLKIETPEPGRPADEDWVRRTIHTFTNRNKRSMTLNMKSAEGQEIFARLAAGADVIVEGFRPGVMKRLGADYETLGRRNARLVYCSLSGLDRKSTRLNSSHEWISYA